MTDENDDRTFDPRGFNDHDHNLARVRLQQINRENEAAQVAKAEADAKADAHAASLLAALGAEDESSAHEIEEQRDRPKND